MNVPLWRFVTLISAVFIAVAAAVRRLGSTIIEWSAVLHDEERDESTAANVRSMFRNRQLFNINRHDASTIEFESVTSTRATPTQDLHGHAATCIPLQNQRFPDGATIASMHRNAPECTPLATPLATRSGHLRAMPGGGERLLSVGEVAGKLGVSAATVYALVERGELAHVRVSNAIRVAPADLEAFITSRRVVGSGMKVTGFDRNR